MTPNRTSLGSATGALLVLSCIAACGGADAAGRDRAVGGSGGTSGVSGSFTGGEQAQGGSGGTGATGGNGDGGGFGGTDGGGPPALAVPLGGAGDFVILAKAGISTVPTSAITGNIGVSPAAATYITQFSLIADSSNEFSTSDQITGHVYASDYSPPTPSNLTTAVGDMELAFTDAAGRAPDVTELGAGDIGGMTLPPGVYGWSTGLLIPADVTLRGSSNSVWIFQVAGDLIMSSATNVFLAGGAKPKNIFWQVAGAVTLGTTSHCEGILLTQTAITLETGASINGRLLAQTAVSIDGSTVAEPAQ